jgi:hypothetical protein
METPYQTIKNEEKTPQAKNGLSQNDCLCIASYALIAFIILMLLSSRKSSEADDNLFESSSLRLFNTSTKNLTNSSLNVAPTLN